MDNEMIERCAKAVRARDTMDEYAIVRAVIKAMLEPTEKMLKYGDAMIYRNMIDAIIND